MNDGYHPGAYLCRTVSFRAVLKGGDFLAYYCSPACYCDMCCRQKGGMTMSLAVYSGPERAGIRGPAVFMLSERACGFFCLECSPSISWQMLDGVQSLPVSDSAVWDAVEGDMPADEVFMDITGFSCFRGQDAKMCASRDSGAMQ